MFYRYFLTLISQNLTKTLNLETVFDRNSGTCVAPDRAPCFYEQNPPLECPLPEGKFPLPNSCTKYFFCFDSEIIALFECQDGWHFIPGAVAGEGECGPGPDVCEFDQIPVPPPQRTQRREFIDFIRGDSRV